MGLCWTQIREVNQDARVKFCYTAMHGVGYPYALKAFDSFNLPHPIPVNKQVLFILKYSLKMRLIEMFA
jgi:hypothetical protein